MGSILLVEDDADVREALQEVLENASYEVVAAADGAQAMAMLRARSGPFSLILLDWLLPALTGAEVVAEIASCADHCRTPIVVLSGHDRVTPGRGIAAVVAKPVRTRTLVEVVDRLAGIPRPVPEAIPSAPIRDGLTPPPTRVTARTVALRPSRT